ncbi:hypothetical protein PYJP_20390 [Pyrofollis japonicus]|nr:hypothetical protein PYJP_20390 [Pyrofollis japonicus]
MTGSMESREKLSKWSKELAGKGFTLSIEGSSLRITTNKKDASLADLPREFLKDVLGAGVEEIVLQTSNGVYYYFRRRDVEKLLKILERKEGS